MDLSSLNISSNTSLQDYVTPVSPETGNGLIILVNVLLFGSVIIFVGVFVWNFIRAYMGKNPLSVKKSKNINTNEVQRNSMKNKFKPKSNICNVCGEANDVDAKFCKNCGTRL